MENSLAERDKRVIWHPYTPQKYAPDPIPIVKGEGVYLVDSGDNYYIDAISSWWVNLHGHAHPYIAEKIYNQAKILEHVIFAGFTHEPAVELAERIISILPGEFSRVFYSDNGSTAVEVAIKMAVQYWWNEQSGVGSRESGVEGAGEEAGGVRPEVRNQNNKPRNKILALKNSYHGDTFGAMSVSDRSVFTLAFHDQLFEVIFIDPANLQEVVLNLSKGVIHQIPLTTDHSHLTIDANEIACFIYEPLLQAAGGMKMYEAEPLNQLLKGLKEYEIICIADEVMTGFGRTGRLFASEYVETKADIICLSKGLTGGTMALGITACSKEVHDAFVSDDKLKTFFHGHSFTANPLACTAALASLDLLLEQSCIDHIAGINEQHQKFVNQLQTITSTTARYKLQTKNHRCLGTIMAFEIETGKDEYLNTISSRISREALSKGVFIRPLGNTVYIMPPYCITDTQLRKIYTVIVEILQEI